MQIVAHAHLQQMSLAGLAKRNSVAMLSYLKETNMVAVFIHNLLPGAKNLLHLRTATQWTMHSSTTNCAILLSCMHGKNLYDITTYTCTWLDCLYNYSIGESLDVQNYGLVLSRLNTIHNQRLISG